MNTKHKGDIAEQAAILKGLQHGWGVLQPIGDNRRTKTNRRVMLRAEYDASDFDFALVYLPDCDLFYIFPVHVFISYGSEIHMVESDKRQRKPKSADYRDAWKLILQWAANEETHS